MELVHKIGLIAVGGAIGAVLRFAVSAASMAYLDNRYPWGTLIANVAGSYLIGILWVYSERQSWSVIATSFVFVGLIGAFTTFSTFALEGFTLLKHGQLRVGLLYLFGSNLIALLAVVAGVGTANAVQFLPR